LTFELHSSSKWHDIRTISQPLFAQKDAQEDTFDGCFSIL